MKRRRDHKKAGFLHVCLCALVLSFNVAACRALVPRLRKHSEPIFLGGKMLWFYLIPYGLAALAYGPLTRSLDPRLLLALCTEFFRLPNVDRSATNIHEIFLARYCRHLRAGCYPVALILIAKTTAGSDREKRVGLFFSQPLSPRSREFF